MKLICIFTMLLVNATLCQGQATVEIHTVLPRDAIPAIFDPTFIPAEDADVHEDSPMIGVSIGDEHRAYSMVLLNAHEIVNDTVGGKAIASTW